MGEEPPPGWVRFSCLYCGKEYRAPTTAAGRRGKCAGCGSVLQVPEVLDEGVAPGAADPAPAEAQGEDVATYDDTPTTPDETASPERSLVASVTRAMTYHFPPRCPACFRKAKGEISISLGGPGEVGRQIGVPFCRRCAGGDVGKFFMKFGFGLVLAGIAVAILVPEFRSGDDVFWPLAFVILGLLFGLPGLVLHARSRGGARFKGQVVRYLEYDEDDEELESTHESFAEDFVWRMRRRGYWYFKNRRYAREFAAMNPDVRVIDVNATWPSSTPVYQSEICL